MTAPQSALAADTELAHEGLRYWAPGPVPGSVWAVNPNGEPVLRGHVPDEAVRRVEQLAAARRNTGAQFVYLYGQLYGIAHDTLIAADKPGGLNRTVRIVTPCDPRDRVGTLKNLERRCADGGITFGGHP